MEKEIKRILSALRLEYGVFWCLCVLTAVMYETDILPQGILSGDAQTAYMMQVTGILLAVLFIPLSLRMFHLSKVRYVSKLPVMDALKSYRRWSEVRLCLLLAPALLNLSVYYWTMDTAGLLCAGMVLLASLFCVPGRNRLQSELGLIQPEESEAKSADDAE